MKVLLLVFISILFTACEEAPELTELEFSERDLVANYEKGMRLYANNCMSCHGDLSNSTKKGISKESLKHSISNVFQMNHLKGLEDVDVDSIVLALSDKIPTKTTGVEHYNNYCMSCHGDITTTDKRGISSFEIQNAAELIPEMKHLTILKKDILDSISSALAIKTTEYPPLKKQCINPSIIPSTDAKGLSAIQIANTLKSLFGSDILESVGDDIDSLKSITKSDGHTHFSTFNIDYNKVTINNILSIMLKISPLASDRVMKNTTCIATQNITKKNLLTDDCFNSMINKWGMKILRKEVTSETRERYRANFNEFKGDDLKLSLSNLLTIILMEPDFLFMFEDGGVKSEDDIYKLNQFEIAQKLSFSLTQNTPDDELLSLAQSGGLSSPKEISSQVDRLIEVNEAKENITNFYRELFGFYRLTLANTYTTDFLDGNLTASDSALVLPQAQEEINRFFDHITFSSNGNYKDLLTSRYVDINGLSTLSKVYGINEADTALTSRSGVLTRAIIHSTGTNWKQPMHIGAMIRKNLLCDKLSNPPDDFDTTTDELDPDQLHTSREKFESLTKGAACIGCHRAMNGLAFAFENIDSAGRSIASEKIFDPEGKILGLKPVNTQTVPSIYPGYTETVNNGVDLSLLLASAPKAQQCFSRRVVEYFNSRIADKDDGCDIDTLSNATSSDMSLKETFKTHLTSTRFYMKKVKD